MHQHVHVCPPSLNIYRRQFEFCPQLSIVHFLFLLYPQIIEISATGSDKARCNLLTADVNYADLNDSADQDDFLHVHPLHQHTRPLLLAFLLVVIDNRRTGGENITTLSSEILDTVQPTWQRHRRLPLMILSSSVARKSSMVLCIIL
jgi:hypothetical protein